MGIAPVYYGDDRLINNIILCREPNHPRFTSLSNSYNKNNDIETYQETIQLEDAFIDDPPELPVWIEDNVVTSESEITLHHKNATFAPDFSVQIKEKDGRFYLELNVPQNVANKRCSVVNTARLGAPVYTEEPFENPDGSPIEISSDILGENRTEIFAGPFATLKEGKQEILIW